MLQYRLAVKYKESQTTKEKIQKSIEVKKEHLTSLQPGLNAIMQVGDVMEHTCLSQITGFDGTTITPSLMQ